MYGETESDLSGIDPPTGHLSELDHLVEALHSPPVGRYRRQPVPRPGESPGHRGDGVSVAAHRQGPADRFFEAGADEKAIDRSHDGTIGRHRVAQPAASLVVVSALETRLQRPQLRSETIGARSAPFGSCDPVRR